MRRSHQEINGLGAVVGCVDRGDRSDLVAVTVVIEISGFKTALGMREDVYLRRAGDLKDFVKALCNDVRVAFDRSNGILVAEEDVGAL